MVLNLSLEGYSKAQDNHNGQPISVSRDRNGSSTTDNNQGDIKTKVAMPWYKDRF